MKAKCVNIIDALGRSTDHSEWIKLGSIYHVLSLFIDEDGVKNYIINTGDYDSPQLTSHRSECFEIVTSTVPSNWMVWLHPSSAIGISPKTWQENDFIDKILDKDPDAIKIFHEELKIILMADQ